jgi:hypothetical protein
MSAPNAQGGSQSGTTDSGQSAAGTTGAQSGSEGGAQSGNSTQQQSGQTQGAQSGADTVSRSEYEALQRRLQAADTNAAQVAAKLKEFEDKDKSELTKAQEQAAEALKNATAAQDELKSARIQNAFLSENTHTWHNPGAALKLLDLSDVTIGDDGKVTGLKAAIEKLAKDHPYLIKTDAGSSGDGKTPEGKSGASGGGSGAGGGHVIQDRERRFPKQFSGSR